MICMYYAHIIMMPMLNTISYDGYFETEKVADFFH